MSVFYKCFKKTHEVNDPAAPVYRAVLVVADTKKIEYICNVLCNGVEREFVRPGHWILEWPERSKATRNLVYSVSHDFFFHKFFTPVTVNPWILSGGIDLSKC